MPIRLVYIALFLTFVSCSESNTSENTNPNSKLKSNPHFEEVFSIQYGSGCRGMEIFNDRIYFSGIKGTIFSVDSKGEINSIYDFNHDSLDFRDLLVVDENTVLVCNSGSEKGYLFKISNGIVDTVYNNSSQGVFLDDLAQDEEGNYYCLGDPIDGKLFLLQSKNKGQSWVRILEHISIPEGEFFFAASGACMDIENGFLYLAIGGANSYIAKINLKLGEMEKIPSKIPSGESSGINAILVENDLIYAVGGDYTKKDQGELSFEIISDSSLTANTFGYRSSIAVDKKLLVCAGTNGIYYSTNFDLWQQLNSTSYYKVILANNYLYCSGPEGIITAYKITYE